MNKEIPPHYKLAIKYIDAAMNELYCKDNKEKSVSIYNQLSYIKLQLEEVSD